MAPVPLSSLRQVQGEISLRMAQWKLAPARSWLANAHRSAAASACVRAIIVCAGRGWAQYWRGRSAGSQPGRDARPTTPRTRTTHPPVCTLHFLLTLPAHVHLNQLQIKEYTSLLSTNRFALHRPTLWDSFVFLYNCYIVNYTLFRLSK